MHAFLPDHIFSRIKKKKSDIKLPNEKWYDGIISKVKVKKSLADAGCV